MRWMLAQLNPTIGDLHGNYKKILQTLDQARLQKIDAVVFPELILCGYPPEDLLLHYSFVQEQQKLLDQIVKYSSDLIVFVGHTRICETPGKKPLRNSVAVIEDRKIVGFVDKQLLPTYDVFDERRYFATGNPCQIWHLKGKKVGVLICEDMWEHAQNLENTIYHTDPVLQLKELQPDIVLNISASPYQIQKSEVRINVASKCARTLQVPVLFCCQVGGNDQLVFDGYSFCVDHQGKLCHLAKGFCEDLLIVESEKLGGEIPFEIDPLQDLFSALALGVKDYMHKSGFKKGCVGLSGGIDSALVAAIAVEALGKENVLCVLMPSSFTAKESIEDAKTLSAHLGVELLEIGIDKPFNDFVQMLSPFFQQKPLDVTEENLQARIRGLILMALSNKLGHIVLSTGNKSEMGTGYCTLYGDMCGGLSVISDVTKKQVYALCSWINRKQEIIPQGILARPPSAELRYEQKDSDSLPPYDIVDAVVQDYVEQCQTPEQIAEERNIPIDTVLDLVRKIHSAEYKRRQAAPGIRVSKKSFHVGRRYPIVQKWVK